MNALNSKQSMKSKQNYQIQKNHLKKSIDFKINIRFLFTSKILWIFECQEEIKMSNKNAENFVHSTEKKPIF